jgi:hypothetical protein
VRTWISNNLADGSDDELDVTAEVSSPGSSSACPPASRFGAAAFSASSSRSSWADPTCSILRAPRREPHTICTAVAPDAVLTVRMSTTTPQARARRL